MTVNICNLVMIMFTTPSERETNSSNKKANLCRAKSKLIHKHFAALIIGIYKA